MLLPKYFHRLNAGMLFMNALTPLKKLLRHQVTNLFHDPVNLGPRQVQAGRFGLKHFFFVLR